MNNIQIRLEHELTPEEMLQYQEIFVALLKSGGGTGVKNGKTVLHFDRNGRFVGIELDYWPWRKRDYETKN